MFENDVLDFFSRCHPLVVPVLYVPGVLLALAASARLSRLSVASTILLFTAGTLAWTLAEYWLHRIVFHFQGASAMSKRLHFLAHGVHHHWPHDKYRLVMPPGVSVPLYFGCLCLSLAMFGSAGWAVHAGFVFGYAYYDLTHWRLHHGRPRTAYGRRLRRHHLLHHFKETDARFGVSNLVWDKVFGTSGEAIAPDTRSVRFSKGERR
ncbi:MAG TPA: sterol desaturase family protein [Polyangiaceae bacterium]|jgi:sterol desaturase/sphingolipid hydroxylase (fatty acid hydroxylase superfamily)|nr:sterol desaturase family protein [Polyangiaceae bacterium]